MFDGDVIARVWPNCSPDHVCHSISNSDQLHCVTCIPRRDDEIQVAV
jgi:hypothetical protein